MRLALDLIDVRSFIAIDLSPELLTRLADLIGTLESRVELHSVRWPRPESIHLTVKFLGDVPNPMAPRITELVQAIAGERVAFPLQLHGLGGFPSLRQPRVIWVGVREPSGALARLALDIDVATERLGYPREDRPYEPHITIGRVRRGLLPAQVRRLGEALGAVSVGDLGEMQAAALWLYASQLRREGALYTPLSHGLFGLTL